MVGLASDGYRKMLELSAVLSGYPYVGINFKKNVYIHKLRISQGSEKSFLHVG